MIKKILKINNVGRFRKFASINDDLSFKETTLIFGYNTYGKSTLTSIFTSLRENNNNYIYGRKSFNSEGEQEIEILFDTGKKIFGSDSWNTDNIEIFNNDFISKNVFYGDEIGNAQQSNLYSIFIDESIKTILEKIKLSKEKQTELETERDKLKYQYSFPNVMPFELFLNQKEILDIDKKIKDKQEEIKQLQNINRIKNLLRITFIRNNFSTFKENLSKTLDLSIEGSINKHVNAHWKNKETSRDFLSTGLDLLNASNACVFCGQDLSPVNNLIESYKKVFSQSYKDFKDLIKSKGDKFLNLDIEKEFLIFKDCGIDLENTADKELLINSKRNIDIVIKNKQQNLNLEVNFETDPDFINFEKELAKIKAFFETHEKEVKNSNDSDALTKELKKLEVIKERYSVKNIELCKNFEEKEKAINLLKKTIIDENNNLAIKSNEVFEKNQKNINEYLNLIGANFKLEKFTPKKHMGMKNTHFCDYSFVFDNTYSVPITNKQSNDSIEPEELPHFKNTFSDSDRRVLAFALFLSKIKSDKKLESKIIIFDDPFASFDENRRDKTAIQLRDIKNNEEKTPLQKIILTHDISFLCSCFKLVGDSNNKKVLKISNSITNGSILEYVDIEEEFLKDDFFKDLDYIKHAADKSVNLNEALKKARPCIENILKRKYYFSLDKDTLKSKSITTYLDKIGTDFIHAQELLDLDLHKEMHDEHPILKLNDPAKVTKLRDFLNIIKII